MSQYEDDEAWVERQVEEIFDRWVIKPTRARSQVVASKVVGVTVVVLMIVVAVLMVSYIL